MPGDYRRDSISGVAVPQRRDLPRLCSPRQYTLHFLAYLLRVATNQNIGSNRHRNRTLGIFTDCQARHTQEGCLLLNASRVGDDHACPTLQSQKLKVGSRLE